MMMSMSINESKDWSVEDDDQLMMIMSASNQRHLFDSNSEYHQSEVKKQRRRRRRRKPAENMGGGGGEGKRKLTEHQAAQMELYFESEPKLETERKEKIAAELGLEPRQVAVWFQNRRARWKCKKLEDEYANLRASHHCLLAEKANLEVQVSELSGRLLEAKCEIQRLSGRPYESGTPSISNGTDNNTPSSSSIIMSSLDHHAHKGFEVDDVQMLEKECVQFMDFCWMNNYIHDLM